MNTGGGAIKKKFVYLKSGSAKKKQKTKYEYGRGNNKKQFVYLKSGSAKKTQD